MKAGILIGLLTLLIASACDDDDCADCAVPPVDTPPQSGTTAEVETSGGTGSGGTPATP